MESLFGDNTENESNIPSPEEHLFSKGVEDEFQEVDTQDAIKVEPKKRVARSVRRRLTAECLSGPRGLQTIEDYFSDITFKGHNFEIKDANEIMHRLQHWAHRLQPTYNFDDILTHIERLGKKKSLHVHMSRYRLGTLKDINVPDKENDEDENELEAVDTQYDEFDALIGEQIAISKLDTREHSRRGEYSQSNIFPKYAAISDDIDSTSRPIKINNIGDTRLPPITTKQQTTILTSEQLARIAKNKLSAQQRRSIKQQGRVDIVIPRDNIS